MSDPWTLALQVRPGEAVGSNLHNPRQDWVKAVAGRTAARQMPTVLPLLFNLCGVAHRRASELALIAAGAHLPPADCMPHGMLARETFAEHVRRMCSEWPPLFASLAPCTGLDGSTWARAPLRLALNTQTTDAAFWLAANAWLQDAVLGTGAALWWRNWLSDGLRHAANWAQQAAHPVAVALRAAQGLDAPWPCSVPALDVRDRAQLRAFAQQVLDQPVLCHAPTWSGACAHTGAWTRDWMLVGASAPDPAHARIAHGSSPWHCMVSRLAECVRLVLEGTRSLPDEPDAPATLAVHCATVRPGVGVAAVEMARGVLIHVVQLADSKDALVQPPQRYRVVAPTEWNFHPKGMAAQSLACLQAGLSGKLAVLMAALDPCVAYEVTAHARSEAVTHA